MVGLERKEESEAWLGGLAGIDMISKKIFFFPKKG